MLPANISPWRQLSPVVSFISFHADFVLMKHFGFTNNVKKVNPLVPILVTEPLNPRFSTFIFSLGWILRIDARRKHKVLLGKNGQDYLLLPDLFPIVHLPTPRKKANKNLNLLEPSLVLL